MIRSKTYLILIATGVLLASCTKSNDDIGSDYQDDIQFFVAGEVDGSSFQRYAGADDYGLVTSYEVDTNGVVSMSGSMESATQGKANAFEIRLRGKSKFTQQNTYNADEALGDERWAYTDPSGQKQIPGEYQLDLMADSPASGLDFQWTFGNGQITYGSATMMSFNDKLFPNFEVKLKSTRLSTNCESSVTRLIEAEGDCKAAVLLDESTVGLNFMARISANEAISSVSWRLNGTAIGTGDSISGAWSASVNLGVNVLETEVSFISGCQQLIRREIKVQAPGIVLVCYSDFSYEKKVVRTYDSDQLSTAEVIYYDASGTAYSSAYEGVEGIFTLKDIHMYQENENGDRTMRFHFELKELELRSADGEIKILSNTYGEFVVAHP